MEGAGAEERDTILLDGCTKDLEVTVREMEQGEILDVKAHAHIISCLAGGEDAESALGLKDAIDKNVFNASIRESQGNLCFSDSQGFLAFSSAPYPLENIISGPVLSILDHLGSVRSNVAAEICHYLPVTPGCEETRMSDHG